MKKKYVIFVVLIVFIFISGLYLLKKEYQNEPKQEEKTEEVQKEETKTSKLSLIMVGDALLHGSVYRDAYKNGVYNFDSQ